MKAYHFTSDKLRDGSPIPAIGEWLEYEGEVIMCQSGLHYSKHPFDALQYAPGNLLHVVEVEKIVTRQQNKGVCRRRKIIMTINAEPLLREFAHKCALDVLHLWDAPPLVREYLETGNEELRAALAAPAAAGAAAWAAWAAAWDAGSTRAAWDAAVKTQRARFRRMVIAAFKEAK